MPIRLSYIQENHKVNLIFGYENSVELFTTIIILKYNIDDTLDNSTILLRLIDAHIRICMCKAFDLSNINLNF